MSAEFLWKLIVYEIACNPADSSIGDELGLSEERAKRLCDNWRDEFEPDELDIVDAMIARRWSGKRQSLGTEIDALKVKLKTQLAGSLGGKKHAAEERKHVQAIHVEWRRLAQAEWAKEPNLSARAIATRIARGVENPDTIRRVIAKDQ